MPHRLRIESLEAELQTVKDLLKEAKEIGDPVGELQFSHRADELSEELANLKKKHPKHASVALFFGGGPVIGSRGIAAEFAGKTLESFQDIIAKAFVRTKSQENNKRGPVPKKGLSKLMITGITYGSFGFVLDEISEQGMINETHLKNTVKDVTNLIQSVGAPEEENFYRVVGEFDPRTLKAVQKFFKELYSKKATIRIVEEEKDVELDEESIFRGKTRMEEAKMEEAQEEFEGMLKGFLVEHRRFELVDLNGDVLYGWAAKEAVKQVEKALKDGLPVLGKKCKVKMTTVTIKLSNQEERVEHYLDEFIDMGN